MLQAPRSYYKLSESTLKKLAIENKSSYSKPAKTQSSVGSSSTPHAPRGVPLPRKEPTLSVEEVMAPPTSAWAAETILVKPFRRTQHKPAPTGVPRLDLSTFNEPDAQMKPVRIHITTATERSLLSWGPNPMDQSRENDLEQLTVEDIGELSDREATPTASEGENMLETSTFDDQEELNTSLLEPAQTKFIEAKVLSNERSQPQPALNGVLPRHPQTRGAMLPEARHPRTRGAMLPEPRHPQTRGAMLPEARHPQTRGAMLPEAKHPQTRAAIVPEVRGKAVMVPDVSLSKKLRFEARVLTQNGRDVHRELCGFYFLADGSITVYEFRQFGKKLSALPIIQRGVYSHLFGPRRGNPYEINVIKKGKTLHFHTSDHASLPDTLSSRPLLTLMVTFVDEAAKKLLLTEGLNPVEVRQVEHYLTDCTDDSRDLKLYRTLQDLVVSRLVGRASKTLVGLGRQLVAMGDRVTKQQLQQALRNFHISLTVEDMNQLWVLICSEQNDLKVSLANSHHSNASSQNSLHGNGSVSVDGLISRLVGPLSEDRLTHVRRVFRKLDANKMGVVDVEIFHRFFAASQHPKVLAGLHSPEEVWLSLTDCLQPVGRSTSVSYADFEHYYLGVSIETDKDSDFLALLKNSWSL